MPAPGAASVDRVRTDLTLVGEGNEGPFNIDHLDKTDYGPFPVASPEAGEVKFEIWLVHGLTGNREVTWTHTTTNKSGETTTVFWPKEFLARDFPNARIISYGYDASFVKFGKSWEKSQVPNTNIYNYGKGLARALRDHRRATDSGRRLPVYFVGHSLGGLVIKSALGICLGPSADEGLAHIARDTAGIIFMGTPHGGSKMANWGSHLSGFLPSWVRNRNKNIMRALQADNIDCKRLNDAFMRERDHGGLKHVKIFCFYETMPMRLWEVVDIKVDHIVNQESAVLPGSESLPIDEDHRGMVRFQKDTHAGYQGVKSRLDLWWEELDKSVAKAAAQAAARAKAAKAQQSKNKKNKKGGGGNTVNFGDTVFHGGSPQNSNFSKLYSEEDINLDNAKGRTVSFNYYGSRDEQRGPVPEMNLDSSADEDASDEEEDGEAENEEEPWKKDTAGA